ncbi:MAG: hypothetical protein ACRDHP_09930, partial [Ktedonobacterales bacterium]
MVPCLTCGYPIDATSAATCPQCGQPLSISAPQSLDTQPLFTPPSPQSAPSSPVPVHVPVHAPVLTPLPPVRPPRRRARLVLGLALALIVVAVGAGGAYLV